MPSCLHVPDLAALRHLTLRPRRAVPGHYAGRHASPQRGRSVEFLDYRDYSPGDPPADLDWKVYARRDKLFVKRFQHQADLTTTIVVDASASMAYAGLTASPHAAPERRPAPRGPKRRGWYVPGYEPPPPPSKFFHAARLAAGFAFLIVRQQDKVGLALAQQGLLTHLPARPTFPHLRHVVNTLDTTTPRHEARLADALHRLAARRPRRGTLLILSDLHEEPRPILDALSRFVHAGHDVTLLHLLHADELTLPDLREAVFVDSETGREVRINLDDLRHDYDRKLADQLDTWRRHLRARGIRHHLVSTATPYLDTLRQHLSLRSG